MWVLLTSVWLGRALGLLERDADSLRLIVDVEHEAEGALHAFMLRASRPRSENCRPDFWHWHSI